MARLGHILRTIFIFLLVISAAIAAPILLRPFYYGQIGPLQLEKTTGYSKEEIVGAYDDVMDYLVGGSEFGTGTLPWSEGKSHFADCRTLFQLDFWVAGISAAALLVLVLLRQILFLPHRAFRHTSGFYAAVISLVLFGAAGIWGAISFDSLFVAFHSAFFPGKSNWIFDPAKDAIINILPESFFASCGILIVSLILVANILLLVWDGHILQKRAREF